MKNTKIVIISLDKSGERVKQISKALDNLSLTFDIFDAVDGRDNKKHYLFTKYNHRKRLLIKGKPLRGPQLGCYSSHYLLWEKCVSLNEPIIVLEDDAVIIPDQFLNFYNNIQNVKSDYQCIRLFYNQTKKSKFLVVENFDAFEIIKFLKGPMYTVGYYLTPAGAEKFLENSGEWILPVDIYMDRFWQNKVECYGVTPVCVAHGGGVFGSDIGKISPEEEKVKRNFFTKIRREIFAAKELISRMTHNLKYRFKFFREYC